MQILQISTSVPKNKYSTEELIEAFPCELPEGVKRNALNLGVSKRHVLNFGDLNSETVLCEAELVDLCVEACEHAIEKAGLSVGDIGYFVVTYDANPFLCPGLSQLLISKLGLDAFIKNVNIQGVACSAFAKALKLAEDHLFSCPEDFVLLCISGVNSYWFHNQVRGLRKVMEISEINSIRDEEKRRLELRKWIATMEFFLFGDGVASIIVAKEGKGAHVEKLVEVTNLDGEDYLAGYARLSILNEPFKFGFYSHLDKEIPKLGIKYTAEAIKKLLGENAEKNMRNAKKWAIHTGSEKILNKIAEHYNISREKLRESYEVLREYGNLAGASLPFILEKILSGNKLSKDDVIIALGYGWGFSASACMLKIM